MRTVLDVNVLVSARITSRGEADKILAQAKAQYDLLLSDFVLHKTGQVLRYPRIQARYPHITEVAIADYLATLRDLAIPVIEKTSVTESIDPEDNRVLAAAVDGQADYLVTYNLSHFPSTYGQVKIVSPADFHRLIRQAQARP